MEHHYIQCDCLPYNALPSRELLVMCSVERAGLADAVLPEDADAPVGAAVDCHRHVAIGAVDAVTAHSSFIRCDGIGTRVPVVPVYAR